MVNLAVRIQGLAGPNEILFSDTVLKDERAVNFLAKRVKKIQKYTAKLRGLKGTHSFYKLIR
jgi:class 3 adenylate cyclase